MLIASVVYLFIYFTLPSLYKLIHPETSLFYNIWGLVVEFLNHGNINFYREREVLVSEYSSKTFG